MENGKWIFKNYWVDEVEFDGQLHEFEIVNNKGFVTSIVTPASIEDMKECIEALNRGEDPIGFGWENGKGEDVSLEQNYFDDIKHEVIQKNLEYDCDIIAKNVFDGEYQLHYLDNGDHIWKVYILTEAGKIYAYIENNIDKVEQVMKEALEYAIKEFKNIDVTIDDELNLTYNDEYYTTSEDYVICSYNYSNYDLNEVLPDYFSNKLEVIEEWVLENQGEEAFRKYEQEYEEEYGKDYPNYSFLDWLEDSEKDYNIPIDKIYQELLECTAQITALEYDGRYEEIKSFLEDLK